MVTACPGILLTVIWDADSVVGRALRVELHSDAVYVPVPDVWNRSLHWQTPTPIYARPTYDAKTLLQKIPSALRRM